MTDRTIELFELDRRAALVSGVACAAAFLIAHASAHAAPSPEKALSSGDNSFDTLAASTVQVIAGDSAGSGFIFRRGDVIVTNNHVVSGAIASKVPIIIQNIELSEKRTAGVIQVSEAADFALLKLEAPLPEKMPPLQPGSIGSRGAEVLFAGYPHGLPQLLVNKAWVSQVIGTEEFVIGGNINAGNSGGPVIEVVSGKVVGIASARRFINAPELDKMKQQQDILINYLRSVSGHGSVSIMGVDFGSFAQVMAESLNLIQQAMISNANTGIGIVRAIEPANVAFDAAKL